MIRYKFFRFYSTQAESRHHDNAPTAIKFSTYLTTYFHTYFSIYFLPFYTVLISCRTSFRRLQVRPHQSSTPSVSTGIIIFSHNPEHSHGNTTILFFPSILHSHNFFTQLQVPSSSITFLSNLSTNLTQPRQSSTYLPVPTAVTIFYTVANYPYSRLDLPTLS